MSAQDTLTIDKVAQFLGQDNRIDIYKKMLAAMLSYSRTRKPIVICDTAENTSQWIAALRSALPDEIAQSLSFASSSEDNPTNAPIQLHGVDQEGLSQFPPNSHFIFDLYEGLAPDIKAEGSFYDFMDIAFSYDSMKDFHEFVIGKLSYRKADEDYCNAYDLYLLHSNGLGSLSPQAFIDAIRFSELYAHDSINSEFKAMAIEKIIATFASPSINKGELTKFYKELDAIYNANGASIKGELIEDDNRESLLASLESSEEQWRWDFMVEILCEHIIDQSIPIENLSLEHKYGKIIGEVLSKRLTMDINSGFVLVTRVISRFSFDWNYLANMALNLEGVILDAQEGEAIINKHWKYVYDMFVNKHRANRENVYKLFLFIDREDQVYEIFSEFMSRVGNIKAASELFNEQLAIQHKHYKDGYLLQVYNQYYDFISNRKESAATSAKRELLKQLARANISTDFTPKLINETIDNIPLSPLSKDNEEMVAVLMDYHRGQRAGAMPDRLILLGSGRLLSKVRSANEVEAAVDTAKRIAARDTITLESLSGPDTEKYLSWVGPPLYNASKAADELSAKFDLFKHTQKSSASLVAVFAKESMAASKDKKDYSPILFFLDFLFNVGNADDRKAVGKIFCRLSRQNLETLDEAIKEEHKDNVKFLLYWSEVHEVAATTNPILASIGNLFRRRK